jgi:16S rRNA (adenine1518-N6/adenine1519-N6)-dimethyltransferase
MMKTMEKRSSKRSVPEARPLKAKKSLGQHFLMHARTALRIAAAAELTEDSIVFEIGPGTGMLTKPLVAKAGRVIALEADIELYEELRQTFSADIASGKLELVLGDVRTFPIETLPKGYVVVANIPYYLTGEIFRRFLESARQPAALTLLVQKEVAERIARTKKKENLLSLSVKAYGTPTYEFTVPRGAFSPAPNVDSAVISVRDISRGRFASAPQEARFFALLRAGFAHKRKLLAKNLATAGFRGLSVPEKARAEDLTLLDWIELSKTAG